MSTILPAETPDDIDRNDLREFIRMQRHDTFTQRGKTFNRGLDQQQAFIAAPNLAFPAIRRYDARKPVDAGCKAFLDECAGNPVGSGFVRAGAQDQDGAHSSQLGFDSVGRLYVVWPPSV